MNRGASGSVSGCASPLFVFSCSRTEQPGYRKVPVAPALTREGGLLTQKSAYSPESAFPQALLHAKTTSAGRVHTEGRAERTTGPLSSQTFFFLNPLCSSHRFLQLIYVELNAADAAAAFVLRSQSRQQFFLRVRLSSCCV